MTLSGITGLGAIVYFAIFGNLFYGTNGTNRTPTTYASHGTQPQEQQALSKIDSTSHQLQAVKQTPTKNIPRGPWSAGNDQFYADLTREELARLGIVTYENDTVRCYNIDAEKKQECWTLTRHSSGGKHPSPPPGVNIPKFFPILATMGLGHEAAYRIEDAKHKEWGMIGDNEMEEQFRKWLLKPGTLGYHLLGFTESSYTNGDCKDCPGTEYDTVKIEIVKNLPQPLIWPLQDPIVSGISDSAIKKVVQLGHYYEGTAKKPKFEWPEWPLNLTVKVDTINVKDLVTKIDSEENSSAIGHIRSVMARINDLVPVIVRPKGGSGAPDSNDFIFWYEPSKELFNALPAAQATVFRTKLAEPPHCLTAPNAVLTTAEITYCVAEPQNVQVVVRDLTGKLLIIMSQLATAGDNVMRFTTETLSSGMYIVSVYDKDGKERSQRLWVENAHPRNYKEVNSKGDLPHSPDQMIFVNNDEPPSAIDKEVAKEHPGLLNIPSIELNAESLAKLGIESDSELAGIYSHGEKSNVVNYLGIMRTGSGAKINTLDKGSVTNVNVPPFMPTFVTDGLGVCHINPGGDTTAQANAFAEIDKLIPILLREKSTSDSITKRDLIFWYKPTPEFLALLPDSARVKAQQMIAGNGNVSASVEAMHGAISKAVAYPNPSKGRFSIRISMSNARVLTFTLRNLLGQQVAPPVEAHTEGSSEQALDYGTLAEGVYLLDITSDQGERFIQRLVIAR